MSSTFQTVQNMYPTNPAALQQGLIDLAGITKSAAANETPVIVQASVGKEAGGKIRRRPRVCAVTTTSAN